MKIIGWCMHNNIKIAISPDWKDSLTRWQIEKKINGKKIKSVEVLVKLED